VSVVLLSGSPSERSRSAALLSEAGRLLGRHGVATPLISVRDLPAEDLLYARADSSALRAALRAVDGAWGLVIATPVYKASFTGILKAFLDLLPAGALSGKAILPLAVGGSAGHMLAVDYTLRPVLSALGGTRVLAAIYAVEQQIDFAAGDACKLDQDIALRLDDSVRRLLHDFAPPDVAARVNLLRRAKAEYADARCPA
jgi:FMN reductase